MENNIVLKFENVHKRFGSVQALQNVSFEVEKGEVHCLVGENGAGKSTLMKILSGAYMIDEGSIRIDGREVRIHSPADAARLGIAVVYQEINTVEKLSIVDNMMLGREHSHLGFNNLAKNREEILPYLEMVELKRSPDEHMENLSPAEKQMVMIAKALLGRARAVSDIDVKELITKMVGRELTDIYPPKNNRFGEEILSIEGLNSEKLRNVSFTLHRGEVLGLAGLVGSGRTEILRAIFGAERPYSGAFYVNGSEVKILSPKDSIRHGMGLVPEERKTQGLINCLSVKDNINIIHAQLHAKHGFVDRKHEDNMTEQFIRKLQIHTPDGNKAAGRLSGGNQQKVVLSKWLAISPDILLLDEPTQGIDVGAKAEIYQLINELAQKGMGVIMVSSDLIEIINVCTRILVMREGRITGEVTGERMTENQVMMYAMGVE